MNKIKRCVVIECQSQQTIKHFAMNCNLRLLFMNKMNRLERQAFLLVLRHNCRSLNENTVNVERS